MCVLAMVLLYSVSVQKWGIWKVLGSWACTDQAIVDFRAECAVGGFGWPEEASH